MLRFRTEIVFSYYGGFDGGVAVFNELVKNFNTVREYLREFYIYGFKSRDGYGAKSGRLYDDMRRRIESWLGGFVSYRRTADGKNVYITIDSRSESANPLYRALKTKSFTDGEIALHFVIFDILADGGEYALSELVGKTDAEYSDVFGGAPSDISTVRKKLAEYEREGLISSRRVGNKVLYSARFDEFLPSGGNNDALDFFSEVAPCGVVGSFLSDKRETALDSAFAFKHHYITQALDSEILCKLLAAISGGYAVKIDKTGRRGGSNTVDVLPVRIFVSVGGGRQYLAGFGKDMKKPMFLRLDLINDVTECGKMSSDVIARCKTALDKEKKHIWGASCGSFRLAHVEFTVAFADDEEYIYDRLLREKRCGSVCRTSATRAVFSADIYDAYEILPWMRTFIGRIVDYKISDKSAEKLFASDLSAMCELYGVGADCDGTV